MLAIFTAAKRVFGSLRLDHAVRRGEALWALRGVEGGGPWRAVERRGGPWRSVEGILEVLEGRGGAAWAGAWRLLALRPIFATAPYAKWHPARYRGTLAACHFTSIRIGTCPPPPIS